MAPEKNKSPSKPKNILKERKEPQPDFYSVTIQSKKLKRFIEDEEELLEIIALGRKGGVTRIPLSDEGKNED